MKTTKRLEYIDLCKSFAIFCVLLGHSLQYCENGEPFDNSLWTIIYAFHMPLFMMLSGYFLQSSFKLPFKTLVTKKFKQLIIPTISVYICINLPILLIETNTQGIALTEYWWNFYNSAWFLKSLFVCYIIAYLSKILLRSDIVASLTSILFVMLWGRFNDFHISTMLPFFWYGYIFSKYREAILANKRIILGFSSIVSFILLLFWDGYYTVYFTPLLHPFEIDNLIIYAFRFIIGLSCSTSVILICKCASDKYAYNSFFLKLTSIGRNTLGIYLLQIYTLEILIQHLHLGLSSITLYFTSLFLAIIELLLCNFMVIQMRKNFITRTFFLGENKA